MKRRENGAVSIVSIFLVIIIIALAGLAIYLYMDLSKLKKANATASISTPTKEIELEEETKTKKETETEIIQNRLSELEGNSGVKFSTNLSTKTYAIKAVLRRKDADDINVYLGTDNRLYVEASQSIGGIEIPGATNEKGKIYGLDLGLNDLTMIYEAELGGKNNQRSALIILKSDGYFYVLRNILDSNYTEEKIEVKNPVSCYIPATSRGKTIVVDSSGMATEIE